MIDEVTAKIMERGRLRANAIRPLTHPLEQARRGLAVDATQVEEWRTVPGHEGSYEVSSEGRVRTLDRQVTIRRASGWYQRPVRGVIRKPQVDEDGHLRLFLAEGGRKQFYFVHQLVLAAFVGPYPADKPEIRHLNGNPADNRLGNLAYGTHAENVADMMRHGTHARQRMTECEKGHPFTPDNTYVNPSSGSRRCRRCQREDLARRREKYGRAAEVARRKQRRLAAQAPESAWPS